MKNPAAIIIHATKSKGHGDLPNFVHLGHRHLQKEKSEGTTGDQTGVKEFILPLDLLRMTVSPTLLEDIAEVRIAYQKR